MKLDIDIDDLRFKKSDKHVRDFKTNVPDLYDDKADYVAKLKEFRVEAQALQRKLYASDDHALLLVFQGMDAAGKDGAIRHVFSGVNPQGCQVFSFKRPSTTELDHDFLWRTNKSLPERGRIGIFNRSYYEEVLVVRVHPSILDGQRIPKKHRDLDKIWDQRCTDIRNLEDYLTRQGTQVVKVFLHVSRDVQKKRFLERIDVPEKNWKFEMGDIRERGRWGEYQNAYSEALRQTSRKSAPWYVVPADDKKNARLIISKILVETLSSMDINYPELPAEQMALLAEAKAQLLAE